MIGEIRQELYLIADEMRGMASLSRNFAENVYERERADRMMGLAVKLAAIADDGSLDDIRATFDAEPWMRLSPPSASRLQCSITVGQSCSFNAATTGIGRCLEVSRRLVSLHQNRRCVNCGKKRD